MRIPEIRIQFSWLLYNTVSKSLHEAKAEPGQERLSGEYYEERTSEYRKIWKLVNDKILNGMTDVLELEFKQDIIDVDLAPWMPNISSPLIIGFYKLTSDTFIDTLTHELAHNLLTDNNVLTLQGVKSGDVDLLSIWKDLFGDDHSFVTLVHIPVHAICKYVYLDILKEPYRLERDIGEMQSYPDYKAAWEYVEANNYKEIIPKLKKSYKQYESKK